MGTSCNWNHIACAFLLAAFFHQYCFGNGSTLLHIHHCTVCYTDILKCTFHPFYGMWSDVFFFSCYEQLCYKHSDTQLKLHKPCVYSLRYVHGSEITGSEHMTSSTSLGVGEASAAHTVLTIRNRPHICSQVIYSFLWIVSMSDLHYF